MKIIDNDLLSIQEARILLGNASNSFERIKELSQDQLDIVLAKLVNKFKDNIEKITYKDIEVTDYANFEDLLKLNSYLLDNFEESYSKNIYHGKFKTLDNVEKIGVSRGFALYLASPFLTSLTTINAILVAIKAASPMIIVADKRSKEICDYVVDLAKEVLDEDFYTQGLIENLKILSNKGIDQLLEGDLLGIVIDNRFDKSHEIDKGELLFKSTIGNNPVFVEKTANLRDAAVEIISSKTFCHGLLPSVEQSIVVEEDVDSDFRKALIKEGATFLNDQECEKLQKLLFDSQNRVRIDNIGKTALQLAKRAGISVSENTRVLIVNKPYVSSFSPFSREKYFPVLSYYVEDDWRQACEKCIELLLNEAQGSSLGIYSNDEEVIQEFNKRKPVARVIANSGLGFGSTGVTTNLDLSFILSPVNKKLQDNLSLTPETLVYYRISARKTRCIEELDCYTKGISTQENNKNIEEEIIPKAYLEELKNAFDKLN